MSGSDTRLEDNISALALLYRRLTEAASARFRSSELRRALPLGSSRARVTSANAKWSTACEAFDRTERQIKALREEDGRLP